ncbi:PTS sugar transporter subunit IIA [Leuconostoc carnosum]|uniref:PTS system, galactitol-specific IIA component n=2 Tax=Leuconostoc carnosum TaxID=1252 RepID=K0DD10_LEUCJ|nr:PTS sugar transporter subunit IIA [Leuconostoc carnosum]AFT81437.1 PTS system, galactitol-specific IIA component [Leuconostoc carnosum JB16]KAA8330246.1 PTS sugar transporter subunit IIA [Leuconostoc carnosum]KAA8381185.1 PTS sugar transporter subunit IIA [Leuconostoc carnosum]QEA33024.1 PTS sugar transporter subunit IIA [Leuconostoc carnosum]
MLDDKVIVLDSEAQNRTEALKLLAKKFVDHKIVQTSFIEAVLKREESFPTGLATEIIGVAIPHTDVQHVIRSQIGVMRLKSPVNFFQMGDGKDVPVKIIFMLALTKPHEQLEMLQKLIGLIQNKKLLIKILNTNSIENVISILETAGIE